MRILVVGAYGLIGGYVTARLLSEGHSIIGVGRDVIMARRRLPGVDWRRLDLAAMDPTGWRPLLTGVQAVVNCAGVLQDSPSDSLKATHVTAIVALAEACVASGIRRFVQISAAGVETGATAFNRTKREADDALRGLELDWVILRPGLVLAPAAYGGSALLRGLAAFPGFIPAVHADAVVQVVSVEDVVEAAARAVLPDAPAGYVADLVAPAPTTLADILGALRAWLGFSPAPVIAVSTTVAGLGAGVADVLGLLGWRGSKRSTAIAQLAAGVRGDGGEGARLIGFTLRSLEAMLAGWPSGVQERWFARLYFLKPLILVTLSIFWVVSGLVGLLHRDEASALLTHVGFGAGLANGLVIAGAIVDLALGLLVCLRRTAPLALIGMLAVSVTYVLAASLWRTNLWADPLGPLVKVFPAAILTVVGLALMEAR